MKKLPMLLLALVISGNTLFAQNSDGLILQISFFKVEPGMEQDYETIMKEFAGKIKKVQIENGCQEDWVFRRVMPGTEMANQFTHLTIDVYREGAECDNTNVFQTAFPGLSPEMAPLIHKIRYSYRRVVYRTWLNYVTGYNKLDHMPKYANLNFMKTYPGKKEDFKNMQKEFVTDLFKNHSKTDAWHAMERNDIRVGGSDQWDYLVIGGYDNLDDKRGSTSNFPKEITDKAAKKYGPVSELRDLKQSIVTELIMSSRD